MHNNLWQPLNFPAKYDEYLTKMPKHFVKKPNESGYFGVCKKGSGFLAKIDVANKRTILLKTPNAIDAANAYDKHIYDNQIPGKKLNFPTKYPDYGTIREIRTLCKPDKNDDTVVYLVLNNRLDALAPINKDDYERIKYHGCYVEGRGNINISVDGTTRKLSRYIMNVTDPIIFVDHINSNTLDNTRKNLRLSNKDNNPQNCLKPAGCSSDYYGVSYVKDKLRWRTAVVRNGNKYNIYAGDLDEQTAARRRDLFMLMNFPDDHCKWNFVWTEKDVAEWKIKFGY